MLGSVRRTMVDIPHDIVTQICEQAIGGYPYEVCGLVAGSVDGPVSRYYACTNVAESARVYTLDPLEHLRAERDAEDAGLAIVGVVHSHTHSRAYPSPTDVVQAPDPTWHYVICTLQHETPELRSFRIVGGEVTEEPLNIV